MRVIALDPGVTTGVVFAEITATRVLLIPHQRKYTPLQLFTRLKAAQPDIVICEDFEFRPNSPQGLVMTSAHMIGVVMMFCEQYEVPLRMQTAGYGKAFYRSIVNLKKAGVYVGGANYEHSMDAMRHFMQWFTFGPGFKYHKKQKVELKK